MTYTHPGTGEVRDVATEEWGALFGLLKYLMRHSASRGWIAVNGENSVAMLCRSIRTKAFREKRSLFGAMRNMLNTLDAPRCRCGKRGTRIIGGTTFCVSCGPTHISQLGILVSALQRELKDERYERAEKDRNTKDGSKRSLHAAKRPHR